MNQTTVQTRVYTVEEAPERAEAELKMEDPTPEQGKGVIEQFGLDAKPHDCTCEYPLVRTRNLCGHPQTCRYYARWAQERGVAKREVAARNE